MIRRLRAIPAAVWAEGRTAHLLSIVGGWALVTWGIASLTVWQVWPISGGLLLLSVAGWGHLRIVFAAGVYPLSRLGGS